MDYPLIMGVSLIYALAIIFINGLIGALCDILDPRIRSVRQQGASQ
jgi:ABC-type dipeptide/oligopeptide/nickel transport system permease component